MKCIEDEIPFEVPEGWEWSRLQTVTSVLTDGTHKTPTYSDEGFVFLSSKNVTSGRIDWDNIMYIPESLHEELYSRLAPKVNDILLAKNGTTGVAAIVDRDCIFDIYVSLGLIRIVNNIILPKYILYAIGSTFVQDYFNSSLKGIGVPNLHLEHIRKTLIPIPSKNEQKHIVNKIEEILPYAEDVNFQVNELRSSVDAVKAKILNLAIQGKLVPQDVNDEPASVLLERIRAEKEKLIKQDKLKRDRKESIIYKGDDNSYYEKFNNGDEKNITDEIPYEIPKTWEWCRLRHIGNIVGGGTPKTAIDDYWDGVIPWITPADLSGYEEMYISRGARNISSLGLSKSSAQLMPKGTVLFSSRAPIGYVAISNNEISTNQGFKSFIPATVDIASEYMYFCLKARCDNIIIRASGTTFKEISGSEMAETLVPVPPVAEQARITTMLYSAFSEISNIENGIN